MLDEPVVLVVEDERDLADLYVTWLMDEYEVRTAHSGKEALEVVDNGIDIVLLDRRLPDISGDEVLGRMQEQGIDCQVAMVTAVDPDFDILKLDIDEYLTKPVSEDELRAVVKELLTQRRFEGDLQQFLSMASKKQALEAEKSKAELRENTAYDALTTELMDLRHQVDTRLAEHVEPESSTYLRYPQWRLLIDSILIGLVAVALVGIHFALPNAVERIVAQGSPRSDVVLSFLASFVHLDTTHLAGNVVGYLLIAYFTYIVCLRIRAAKWFYLTVPCLLFCLPVVTTVISYWVFSLLYPDSSPVLLGFSDIVSGFVGFSFLAFLQLLRTVYDHRSVFFVAVFVLLAGLGAFVWTYQKALLLPTVAGSALMFIFFIREHGKSGWGASDGLQTLGNQLAVILVVTMLYVVIGLGLIPVVQFKTPQIWILGHILGLLAGFGFALIGAFIVDIFPVRDHIRQDGYTIPRRLL